MKVFHIYNILKISIFASITFNAAKTQELGTAKNEGYSLGSSSCFNQRTEYPRDCAEVKVQCSHHNSSGVFLIKPDGYYEPFEVFCENDVDGHGWTVIQRRTAGFVDFNRGWSDYKEGFGFLGSEFWIGNQKLSFLTNQRNYQLRIDMTNSAGSSFFVIYEAFWISDEFSQYRLVSLGQHAGTADSFIEVCPTNMIFKSCSCQTSCAKPEVCEDTCTPEADESCICPDGFLIKGDACVPPEQCGCYVTGIGVIPDGDSRVNDNCTERCSCQAGTLRCDSSFRCDSNADCEERNNAVGCQCHVGFEGHGQTCTYVGYVDCFEVYTSGSTSDGLYNINPTGWPGSEFEVYCDMSDGGGWTVFQRREDGSVDFSRDWNSYKNGFPETASGELWLGNEKLYYLTNQKNYNMRIDLVNQDGTAYNIEYDEFRISNETDDYELEIRGNIPGYRYLDLMEYHQGNPFSTYDNDNDGSHYNCASDQGGWWYGGCSYRYTANLNAAYHNSSYATGIVLYNTWNNRRYSVIFTEMKVRPV